MDDLRTRYRRRGIETHTWHTHADHPAPNDAAAWVDLTLLLAELPPERRSAFVLTQMLGCNYQQAADICGCAVGTIRSRIARARTELITLLRAAEDTTATPRTADNPPSTP
jgi:RNA polymerase sigma-70 factor (ECF subfamily)